MEIREVLLKCGCIRCGKQPADSLYRFAESRGTKYITTKSFVLPVCETCRQFFINYGTKKRRFNTSSGIGCCLCIFLPLMGFLLIAFGAPGWTGFIPFFIISIGIGIGLISYSVYSMEQGHQIGIRGNKYWRFAFYREKVSVRSHISNQFLPLEQWIVERLNLQHEVIPDSIKEENERIQQNIKKLEQRKREKQMRKRLGKNYNT